MQGIKKSVANVDKLQTSLDNLGRQMTTLIKRQQTTANTAIAQAKAAAELKDSLTRRVQAMEGAQFTLSAFEGWVDAKFADVKRSIATAALPRSEFKKFLASEEEERSQTVCGDVPMDRATIMGAKRTNDDVEDSGGPAAKRPHGRGGSPEAPPTPGADTFATRGPPKTPEKHKSVGTSKSS